MAVTPSAKSAQAGDPHNNADVDGTRDIWNYISEGQWPIMVTILVNDDVEKLRHFVDTSGVDWIGFLQSTDTQGLKRNCPAQFRSYNDEVRASRSLVKHPYPTNPFLIAVMYNATLCCQMIRETAIGLDLCAITESNFTSYHVVFSGLDVIRMEGRSVEEFRSRSRDYVKHFVRDFFTDEEVMRMSVIRNCFYMRPLEWGVYCGYADWVDELMYRSHAAVVQCNISGLMEHVEMDFTSVVSTDATRFVSILSIMAEVYGESRVSELGVFRKPLVLAPLIDAFYGPHRFVVAGMGLFVVLNASVLVASCDSAYKAYVTTACTQETAASLPAFFLSTRCFSLAVWTAILLVTWLGRYRKSRYRNAVGFPPRPRQLDRDCIAWLMPTFLAFSIDAMVVPILCIPANPCQVLGANGYRSLLGTLVLVQLIALICGLTTVGRLLPMVSKFINSFYRSFAMFAQFLIIYVIMLAMFSRLFRMAYRSATPTTNGTLVPESDEFLPEAYRTFLITLNVFENETFRPSSDRIDLIFIHIAFTLLIPTLFINFVVGVLSSVVNDAMVYDVECRYLLRLSFAEYSEATFFWLYRLLELLTRKRRQLVLYICRPLTKNSRSVYTLRDREI